jgi:hypothetical protein
VSIMNRIYDSGAWHVRMEEGEREPEQATTMNRGISRDNEGHVVGRNGRLALCRKAETWCNSERIHVMPARARMSWAGQPGLATRLRAAHGLPPTDLADHRRPANRRISQRHVCYFEHPASAIVYVYGIGKKDTIALEQM